MKNKGEKLFNGITHVKDALVTEAARRPVNYRKWLLPAVAACLALAITLTSLWPGAGIGMPAYALRVADYPDMAQYPKDADQNSVFFDAAYEKWRESVNAQRREGYEGALTSFLQTSVPAFMAGAEQENKLYSPINVYMALAMLAETTGGTSRQQLLDLLGAQSIEALRRTADDLWNAHYRDDGIASSILAASLWLNEDLDYSTATLDRLAETYHASTYQGRMGSEGYNKALRDWINSQTAGLLKENVEGLALDPETVLGLVTTIYLKDKWSGKFNQKNNVEDLFHSPAGDQTVTYMKKTTRQSYFWGDHFTAVRLSLSQLGGMWLFLPDEGYTPADLIGEGDALALAMGAAGMENNKLMKIHLTMPKFDVQSTTDLLAGLRQLGVTDVLSIQTSDFSPLTEEPAFVSQAQHTARVLADEEGMTAVAYTILQAPGASPPGPEVEEIDFTLDRPFLFVITSNDSLPLFTGIVNQP